MTHCEHCSHYRFTAPTMDDPYPAFWCHLGHWEGALMTNEEANAFTDCKDFEDEHQKEYEAQLKEDQAYADQIRMEGLKDL